MVKSDCKEKISGVCESRYIKQRGGKIWNSEEVNK